MRFAMVVGMSDDYRDPSGNTEAFRAFAARPEAPAQSEPQAANRLPLIITIVAAVVVVAIIVAVVALI